MASEMDECMKKKFSYNLIAGCCFSIHRPFSFLISFLGILLALLIFFLPFGAVIALFIIAFHPARVFGEASFVIGMCTGTMILSLGGVFIFLPFLIVVVVFLYFCFFEGIWLFVAFFQKFHFLKSEEEFLEEIKSEKSSPPIGKMFFEVKCWHTVYSTQQTNGHYRTVHSRFTTYRKKYPIQIQSFEDQSSFSTSSSSSSKSFVCVSSKCEVTWDEREREFLDSIKKRLLLEEKRDSYISVDLKNKPKNKPLHRSFMYPKQSNFVLYSLVKWVFQRPFLNPLSCCLFACGLHIIVRGILRLLLFERTVYVFRKKITEFSFPRFSSSDEVFRSKNFKHENEEIEVAPLEIFNTSSSTINYDSNNYSSNFGVFDFPQHQQELELQQQQQFQKTDNVPSFDMIQANSEPHPQSFVDWNDRFMG